MIQQTFRAPWLTWLTALLLLSLIGCGDETVEVKANNSTPEYAASKFFYSIYDTKDIEEAMTYATPKLQRIIKGYNTTSGVSRHLLNMQFDTIEIEVDRGRNLRETYGDEASISLIFRGTWLGNNKTDARTVKMVKRSGRWLVEKIMPDPYAR